jgi:hypothetical protein
MIDQRLLGENGPAVGFLGYGAMVLEGFYGQANDEQAVRTIQHAMDLGMMIGSADAYGNGHNEALVARALTGRRGQEFIATKFGIAFDRHDLETLTVTRGASEDQVPGYSEERQEAVLRKMLPPNNRPLRELAAEEGISEVTLYNWRRQARAQGRLLPDSDAGPEGWSAADKFAAVVATAPLNEAELGEYCRNRGLYPQQIQAWRSACEQA